MLRYRDFFPLAADRQTGGGIGNIVPLSDVLPMGILVTDEAGKCLYSNGAYQALCGWSEKDLIGSHWSSVIHPKDHARTLKHWESALLGQKPFLCESRIQCPSGRVIWTRRNAALLSDNQPGHGYVHTVEDIGVYKQHERARRQAESRLFDAQQWAQVTLDSIGDAVLTTNMDGQVSYMNRVAESLTGFTRLEAVGRPMAEIFQVVDAGSHVTTDNPAGRAISSGKVVELKTNALLVTKDGSEVAIEDSAAPIRNRLGEVTGAVIVFRDARYSRATAARMAYLAQHDELTGLHNRNAFYERFDQSLALARRHATQMALLFIDLDNFKEINDVLGHNNGDVILAALAGKLKRCVRSADTVCRYGGDEFVVLLAEIAQPGHALAVANKIHEAAAEPLTIDGHTLSLQISVGVSVYPEDGQTANALLSCADTAMYRAKSLNRSTKGRGHLRPVVSNPPVA